MTGINLLDLVRKRHEGDGWLVFTELSDKPGIYANRYADALALGVWASKKYEAHLYEFKISREDLKRELRDPAKANAVGKYCTYWWLAVDDIKVIADLVIPDVWGILVPVKRGSSTMLTVHRRGEKLVPDVFDAKFAIALVRNMAKNWVSHVDHDRVLVERDAALDARNLPPPPDVKKLSDELDAAKHKIEQLQDAVKRFSDASGVDLPLKNPWDCGRIGDKVKLVMHLEERMLKGDLGKEIHKISNMAYELERHVHELAETAVKLRELSGGPSPTCAVWCRANKSWGGGQCNCGTQALSEVERKLARDATLTSPSDPSRCQAVVNTGLHIGDPCIECGVVSSSIARHGKNDDQGSGVDRGGAGSPKQDAGV